LTLTKIVLSDKQKRILTENAVGTHTPLHLKTRSQIILNAAKGWNNTAIKESMGIDHKTVRLWRTRYVNNYEDLKRIEAEKPHKIRSAIKTVLSDAHRSGSPPTFKNEQVAAIIAMACEAPSKFNLPFSHWTPKLLQEEAIEQGIVESISIRQIGRFLKRTRFTTPSDPKLVESRYR
jgi:putative transposase